MLNLILLFGFLSLNHSLLYIFRELFVVFMLSMILAYASSLAHNYVANFTMQFGLNKKTAEIAASFIIISLFCVSIYLIFIKLIPVIKFQLKEMWHSMHDIESRHKLATYAVKYIGIKRSIAQELIDGLCRDLSVTIASITTVHGLKQMGLNFGIIANKTGVIFHLFIHIIAIFVIALHILKESWREKTIEACDAIDLSNSNKEKVMNFITYFDYGFRGWLNGQVFISLILSIYYLLCFSFLQLKASIVLALICGFAGFLPYLGDCITTFAVLLSSLFTPNLSFHKIIIIILWIILGHCIGSYGLTPVLMKKHTGVSALQIICGILVFSHFFGILGVVLNVPIWVMINSFFNAFIINDKINQINNKEKT